LRFGAALLRLETFKAEHQTPLVLPITIIIPTFSHLQPPTHRLVLLPHPSYISSHRASSLIGLLVSHSVSPFVICRILLWSQSSSLQSSHPSSLRQPTPQTTSHASQTRTATLFTSRPVYEIICSYISHPSHKATTLPRIRPELRTDCLTPSTRGSTRPYLHPFGSPRTIIISFCIKKQSD